MPIELGIWRINGGLQRVTPESLAEEARLETLLEQDPSLLGEETLIIGRQVDTAFGHRIDLLGVNAEGQLLIIELKRDRTPRDVAAQVLDYASWVQGLSYKDVVQIYEDHARSAARDDGTPFESAFDERFGVSPPETLNEAHRMIIVASELDPATERIISYLSEGYDVPINAVFFRYFRDGAHEYLTRTWLRDPMSPEVVVRERRVSRKKEPWNGRDFYVSFEETNHRIWADARRYGFVSAGQGKWYSGRLKSLFAGARVFVYIPRTGYVGVGTVTEPAQRVRDFTVEFEGRTVPILQAPLDTPYMEENADDPDKSEYLVRVDWIVTVPREEAIWELGMFANQNIACKLRNRFTLERLSARFGLDE